MSTHYQQIRKYTLSQDMDRFSNKFVEFDRMVEDFKLSNFQIMLKSMDRYYT